jgi:hypothetical protein
MTTRDIMIAQIKELKDKEFIMLWSTIAELSNCFQNNMDMTAPEFPDRLRAIMNKWAKISVNNAKSKMSIIVRRVVSREVDTKLVELLIELYEKQNRILNTTDLYNALKRTHTILWYSNWNMNDKLLVEAEDWLTRDGDTLLPSDFVHIIKKTTVYDKKQVLSNNFNRHKDWCCLL